MASYYLSPILFCCEIMRGISKIKLKEKKSSLFRFWRIQNQLDATYYFIVLLIGSTCFGHYMPIIRSSRL